MKDWAYLTLCVALFEITKDPSTYIDDGAYEIEIDYKVYKKIRRNFKKLVDRTKEEYDKLSNADKRKIYYFQMELLRMAFATGDEKIPLQVLSVLIWHERFRERDKPLHKSLEWTKEANIDYICDLLEKADIPNHKWLQVVELATNIAGVM
ncbi:hypothetical protein [Nitratiruptor sp. SB155-2]|uniref:hypothetical protein n=1 Tax=Nitratiruptor sp. (strain SB155-2) TaxID=387092 RepID=UPI000317093E|nr:hypothetical protein [Nitratiruptor sp. SB155-2]